MSRTTASTSMSSARDPSPVFDARPLQAASAQELLEDHRERGISIPPTPTAAQLLLGILQHMSAQGHEVRAAGILEVLPDGFGFLRHPHRDFVASIADIYLSPAQITRLGLRAGDLVYGSIRAPRGNESNFALMKILEIEGESPRTMQPRLSFDDLRVTRPSRLLAPDGGDPVLKTFGELSECRRGNRLLLAGPPKSGATSWLLRLCSALSHDASLSCISLLIDVRPEEAQSFREVHGCWCAAADASSTHEQQARVVQLGMERARRLVERGRDVALIFDSIGAYARALTLNRHTTAQEAYAATKNVFASAREIARGGGSLTIIASLRLDRDDDGLLRDLSRAADRCYTAAVDG